MSSAIKQELRDFKACAADAPEGTYEDAKTLDRVIGETCDNLIQQVKALGLKADNSDLVFEVEAAIYNYVKRSNPDSTIFPVAEGFGSSLSTEARERVIAGAARDRDFLRSIIR